MYCDSRWWYTTIIFHASESQINHATSNSVKQHKQAHITVTSDHNSTVNNITNNIHIHIPHTGKRGSFYTTAKGGSN